MIANNFTPFDPLHPGEVLREELAERGVTQTQLAKSMGISVSLLNEIINGKRDILAEYALLLEAALGIDADFWINMHGHTIRTRLSLPSAHSASRCI